MRYLPFALTTVLALSCVTASADQSALNFSAAWTHVADSDMKQGGSAGVSGVTLAGGSTWSLSGTSSLGLQLRADVDDWRFDAPAQFGGRTPWQSVNRFSLAAPYGVRLGDGWNVSFSPSIESNGDEGAKASKTLGYGLTGMAVKGFAPDKLLGFGLGVYRSIERTRVFPFFVVDWKLGDNWRLSNPLQVGPSGPAGLMLSYQIAPQWELGAGAAYRANRFRLAEDNPIARDGVGEARYVPVFVQATYRGQGGWRFDVYGGVLAGGEIKVMDTHGDATLGKDDVKTAPAFAASFSVKF